jgi:hypothetical protein
MTTQNFKVMKRNNSYRGVGICLIVTTMSFFTLALHAAVTLNANDTFTIEGTPTGDLTVAGDLSVVQGIDFGTTAASPAAAAQLNYYGGLENAVKFDLTDPLGAFKWRDNLVNTVRDKMSLDSINLLSLYKTDGTTGILLNPNTGQINLSGTGSGILSGGNPVFTLDASGKLVFGNWPLSITNTTASKSSAVGALTVAGGVGIAMDSYINGIKVGRGGGNVTSNTAYGVNSLQANITGYSNTANGYYSLGMNTTGSSNTATGYYALYANTTGGYNTSSGVYALRSNTSGYSNTAAGYYALYANITGGSNTAAGVYALRANTSGYSNTATGYYALYANTTGGYNTANGVSAISRNTTGSYNSAHGNYALNSNTTGSSNTVAGYYSLYGNTTGISNVAIGAGAGRYQANGTTYLNDPDNSIYLGANSRGFSNSDQNSIVIGYTAIGEGANTTVIGNSSTTRTHLYGETVTSALNVTGATVLNGQVIITQPQGDISMGIYGP